MELTEGASVYTANGIDMGKINRFVIDPQTQEVTHVVVQKGWLLQEDKVVPITMIDTAATDRIALRDFSDVDDLPSFEEEHFVRLDDAGSDVTSTSSYRYAPAYYWYPPYGFQGSPTPTISNAPMELVEVERNIPQGTVPLEAGAKVISSEGDQVGDVDSVLVDPQTKQATHFIIAQGLLFKERKLIPVQWIKEIEEEKVYLVARTSMLGRLPEYKG